MAQNPSYSESLVTIKLEPTDNSHVCASVQDTSTNVSKCTCGPGALEESFKSIVSSSTKSNKNRDVLVNFGLNRKKVITLKSKKDKLKDHFCDYMLLEPAFSKLLEDSYVVFQEFNSKFGTWVDIDECKALNDGAVVKAVFFPKQIEREEADPGSVKLKKTKKKVIKQEKVMLKSVFEEKQVLEIDLSSDSETADLVVEGYATFHSKESKTKKKKEKGNTNSDHVTHCEKHKSKSTESKRKSNKEKSTKEYKKTKTNKRSEDVGNGSNTESETGMSENVSMPQMAREQLASPISTISHADIRQEHKSKANVSLQDAAHCRRGENFIPPLLPSPHLGEALSLNKKFDIARNNFISAHHSRDGDNNKTVNYYNDAVVILSNCLAEESENHPPYISSYDKDHISCKVHVKGKTFYGMGRTQFRAQTVAAAKAITYFYPHIQLRKCYEYPPRHNKYSYNKNRCRN